MIGDKFADKLKGKLDEYQELKQIENEAYQAEKNIVNGTTIEDKREKARLKGIEKAHKQKGGLSARLDRAADRMKEQKDNKPKNQSDEKISFINFGSKV